MAEDQGDEPAARRASSSPPGSAGCRARPAAGAGQPRQSRAGRADGSPKAGSGATPGPPPSPTRAARQRQESGDASASAFIKSDYVFEQELALEVMAVRKQNQSHDHVRDRRTTPDHAAGARPGADAPQRWAYLGQGLLSNALNPKVALFFVVPAAVPVHGRRLSTGTGAPALGRLRRALPDVVLAVRRQRRAPGSLAAATRGAGAHRAGDRVGAGRRRRPTADHQPLSPRESHEPRRVPAC